MAPRVIRNSQFTARRATQALFVRSADALTREVRQSMRELSGQQIRALRPSSNAPLTLPPSEGRELLTNMSDLLDDLHAMKEARDTIAELAKPSGPVNRDQYGWMAEKLGVARDIDGNVVHVDKADRPYVFVNGGEIVYVKVYQARITPKGVNLDAKCTVASPDGTSEVLLVEPLPTWQLPLP